MDTEAKKQWNMSIALGKKKKSARQMDDDLDSSKINANKYSDTVVSEAVSRRDMSQEIQHHHKSSHNIEIKYNPLIVDRLNDYYGKKNATIKTQKAYQFNLKD